MANPIWITGQGSKLVNLGTVTEGSYFEYPLDAYDPNTGPVTYKFLAGVLPPGIRINSKGLIQGGPYLNTVANETTNFTFSVRASDQNGLVSDKSFTMTVANINPPVIVPRLTNLGEVFDGSFFSLQLAADELNPSAVLTWSLESGSLPQGLSLSSTGLISGFIMPVPVEGNGGTQGYNNSPYNEFAYEAAPHYQNLVYKFTIDVFDGVNYDSLTYTLTIISKNLFTADSTTRLINDTYLTVDHDNFYAPIITTPSQALPEVRANSKLAFQFTVFDPNAYPCTFELVQSSAAGFDQTGQGFDVFGFDQDNLSLPPGLLFDQTTGWLSGTIGAQSQAIQTYSFQIFAYETAQPTRRSLPVTYTLTVLGDINNTINWVSPSDLGYIYNGSVSELFVSAASTSTLHGPLRYSLYPGTDSLPQGLILQSDGLITGRVGFEYFSLDGGTTTVDGAEVDFDNLHTFTVMAKTADGTASSLKTFKVLVKNINATPYENLYIKALPSLDQRTTFLNIVNNNDIFPEELIYRSSDANFGRAKDMRSLFLAGLNPAEITSYQSAMSTNTYNKRINFGSVKSAQAVDSNFNVKYEVVYLELTDSEVYKGKSPANKTYDGLIGQNVYPNSFDNMSSVVVDALGYANRGAIPGWMTSPQSDKSTLGFTRAIVLAYTIPGASKLIAYRLATSGLVFNNIEFILDRYDLDNYLTSNFNIKADGFNLGEEMTFDRIKRPGPVATSVKYGVNLAFNMIHGQTVAQINARGGLDGITNFASGETLVFVQQENYVGETSGYDGWIRNNSVVPGWTEFTNSTPIPSGTPGFPSNPFLGQVAVVNSTYYVYSPSYDISGNILGIAWKLANQRAGVWVINIDQSNVVTLTFSTFLRTVGSGATQQQVTSTVLPSDLVQINRGKSHSDTIALYNPALAPGNSVPAYSILQTFLTSPASNTRFDGYGTRFINNRITHQLPESNDVWLKFPNTGPLL